MIEPSKTNPRIAATSCAFVSFVVCFFLLFSGCGGSPKHPAWTNATGAEQYERLIWKGIRDSDWKNVQYRLAPTFVGVDAQGQSFDRAAWVEHWKATRFTEFSLAEISSQPAGSDMVVTYILHLDGAAGSAPTAGMRVVSVWQQVKKGWILTTTSMTPIAPIQS